MRPQAITIVPRNAVYTPKEFDDLDPNQLTAALRTALYAKGAAKASGWLIVFLHGEHEPKANVYRPHFHGYAYGGMVDVVRRLRQLPNYKTQKHGKDGRINSVYRPVQVKVKRPRNIRREINYRLQSYWPAKAIIIFDDGLQKRASRRRRISEPYHSQVLLWMDRWELSDLTLMIGLRVTKNGLVQTKRSASRTRS
jgi:hypothetical protein